MLVYTNWKWRLEAAEQLFSYGTKVIGRAIYSLIICLLIRETRSSSPSAFPTYEESLATHREVLKRVRDIVVYTPVTVLLGGRAENRDADRYR